MWIYGIDTQNPTNSNWVKEQPIPLCEFNTHRIYNIQLLTFVYFSYLILEVKNCTLEWQKIHMVATLHLSFLALPKILKLRGV